MIEMARRGGVAILTLAHGKASAFDVELCAALIESFKELETDSCSAVVVTGRGSIFCAGVDLLRVVEEGAPYVARFLPALSDAFERIFAFPKPLVAAVNGHAIAGGCILACCADRRIMARNGGRIGLPELQVGVAFPPVPLEIVRFAVNPRFLPELLFNGGTFEAESAVDAGFVDAAVDGASLIDEAVRAAETLALRPAAAFALTKRQLRALALDRMRSARGTLDADIETLWSAPATLDSIRSYIERTFKKPGA